MDAYLIRNKKTGELKGNYSKCPFPTHTGAKTSLNFWSRYYLPNTIGGRIHEGNPELNPDDWEIVKATKWEVV